MVQKIIGLGIPDKGNGDPLRTAFSKVNDNFAELYNSVSAVVVVGATAPINPSVGDLWWNSESGRMYVYYGTAWVDASPVDGAGISSTNELVNGASTVSLGTDGYITLANGAKLYDYGSGTGNGYGITDAVNGTYIGYDPTDTLGALHMDAYNGKNIRIRTTTLPSTYKDWSFGTDGWLTLPNNGVVQANTLVALSSFNDTNNIARVICQSVSNAPQINLRTITSTGAQKDWIFRTDGSLQIPGDIRSEGNINIDINLSDSTLRRWQFGADGALTLPTGGTVSYTPTTATDWNGTAPTTIQAAIDRLAAAFKILNSGTGA